MPVKGFFNGLLGANADRIKGQAFNCYDLYIADQDVAEVARELTGSRNPIADQRRSPKHQIETGKLRALGLEFGGKPLLRETIAELVAAHRSRE
jgi:hypothetical protein